MKRPSGWALTLAAVLAVTAGCSSDGDEATRTTKQPTVQPGGDALAPNPLKERRSVKIGVSAPSEASLPLLLAKERGEFDKENVDVEIVSTGTGDQVALLASGEIGAAHMSFGYLAVLNAIASGVNIRYTIPVAGRGAGDKNGWWVRKDVLGSDGTFQPSDLYGKKLATGGGRAGLVPAVLDRQAHANDPSFDLGKVDVIELARPDIPIALENGAVDGGFMSAPFWVSTEKSGCCVYVDQFTDWPIYDIVFGPQLLKDRELGAAVARAIGRTMMSLDTDYHQDPAVRDEMVKLLQVTPETIDATLPFKMPTDFTFPAEELDGIQDYYRTLEGVVPFEKNLTADQVFDMSFVEGFDQAS